MYTMNNICPPKEAYAFLSRHNCQTTPTQTLFSLQNSWVFVQAGQKTKQLLELYAVQVMKTSTTACSLLKGISMAHASQWPFWGLEVIRRKGHTCYHRWETAPSIASIFSQMHTFSSDCSTQVKAVKPCLGQVTGFFI